ncbi:MAG: S41 family peptidase [Dysgonamonadaceae bacterium]|jgi:carboxyl-terminal processing protease|nr:S41 family peptidase [Dysgonamonadaceae bacterium]
MRKLFFFVLIALAATCTFTQAQTTDNNRNQRYFDINKNIDIFNSVLRELDLFYVDSLEVDKLVQQTIVQMLAGLDPYTQYFSEEDSGDLRFIATGEYGGVGALISQQRGGQVFISQPYEGLPADKAGLRAGDIILEIDGEDLRQASTSQVSSKLRGIPGTTLTIKIQRPGESGERTFTITRESIEIHPITYADVLEDNIGYLHFGSFTTNSSNEVKKTINELKNRGAESLIIDLRGNTGGVLDEAVNIVNFFVPKGEEVVSTRGKVRQWDRTYRTLNQPIDEFIPIIVLTDTGSASASEIVAGALQDLDRAVIIGNRSFGKGLVQMPRELPFGANIKITTSKYFTPSGRSVQALDYSHRNPDGSVARVPDSLTNVFHTRNGREVRDGGGITPDIIIPQERSGTIAFYLMAENVIFDFVTSWVQKNPTIAPPNQFRLSDADYEAFKQFVKSRNFEYDKLSATALNQLRSVMQFEGYMDVASEEFKALEAKLHPNLDRDLDLFKDDIRNMIESEIVQRYYYQRGVLMHQLTTDKAFEEAVRVLKDKELYRSILMPK